MQQNSEIIQFIPKTCPECGAKLNVVTGKNNKYKLVCSDIKNCVGVSLRRFQKGMDVFNISGIGEANYELLFNVGLRDIADVLSVTSDELIGSEYFKSGRALEKILISIQHVTKLRFANVVESIQFEGVGQTVSKVIEQVYNKQAYDFTGLEYAIRDEILNTDSELNKKISKILEKLSAINIEVYFPKVEPISSDTKYIEFTGSPKEFGFSTKEDFLSKISQFGFKAGSLNKESAYLVTDDLDSSSSKMSKARKLGVEIITYGDLYKSLT